MKSRSLHLLFLLQLGLLSATAQESPAPALSASGQQASQRSRAETSKSGPEMQKLLTTMCGKWIYHFKYQPSETRPNGGTGEGEAVFRPGPGGASMFEDEKSSEPGGTSGISVTWWDAKAQGYRAIWCDNKMPAGCIVMSRLAKWEGDNFALSDEFTKDGKNFIFREVVSDITPNSFTQTLSRGEEGKELKLLVTIHAIRSSETVATPTPMAK